MLHAMASRMAASGPQRMLTKSRTHQEGSRRGRTVAMSDNNDFQQYSSGRALHKGSLGLRVTPASSHARAGWPHSLLVMLHNASCAAQHVQKKTVQHPVVRAAFRASFIARTGLYLRSSQCWCSARRMFTGGTSACSGQLHFL